MSHVVEELKSGTMPAQVKQPGEKGMVSKERWETIRRLLVEERVSVSEVARRMNLDRKTVRHWARQAQWKPYSRAARCDQVIALGATSGAIGCCSMSANCHAHGVLGYHRAVDAPDAGDLMCPHMTGAIFRIACAPC